MAARLGCVTGLGEALHQERLHPLYSDVDNCGNRFSATLSIIIAFTPQAQTVFPPRATLSHVRRMRSRYHRNRLGRGEHIPIMSTVAIEHSS